MHRKNIGHQSNIHELSFSTVHVNYITSETGAPECQKSWGPQGGGCHLPPLLRIGLNHLSKID